MGRPERSPRLQGETLRRRPHSGGDRSLHLACGGEYSAGPVHWPAIGVFTPPPGANPPPRPCFSGDRSVDPRTCAGLKGGARAGALSPTFEATYAPSGAFAPETTAPERTRDSPGHEAPETARDSPRRRRSRRPRACPSEARQPVRGAGPRIIRGPSGARPWLDETGPPGSAMAASSTERSGCLGLAVTGTIISPGP